MIKDQDRPEYTYVILDQQPSTDEPTGSDHELPAATLAAPDNMAVDRMITVVSDQNDSSLSLADEKTRRGLLSRTRFSDLTLRILSALLYGICSFLITVINKIVLTSYGFPSSNILGVGQMFAIIVILKIATFLRIVTVRRFSMKNKQLWTLAILYFGNLVTGLGGTKHLPLPMFIALRRFSIALTAIGEFYVLNVRQSPAIVGTITAMIGGSFIAAAGDLTFNATGYLLAMASIVFTAANGVYTKKTIDAREINKHEILFYSALYTILPLILISIFTNNLETLRAFEHWSNLGFILSFLTSCVMGYLLMFSTVLCTHYNSALTTNIVGTIKNILTTYVGMYIGGDYQFSALNFVGLNVSLIGSLVYSYLSFSNKKSSKPALKEVPTKC